MRKIVYFKICEDQNEYNKRKLHKTKYKIINCLLDKIYSLKFKVMVKYNIIEKNDDQFIIYSKEKNILPKLDKKVKQLIKENLEIIFSKQIKEIARQSKYNEKIKSIYGILDYYSQSKMLYIDCLNEIIKSVIKQKEVPEEQSMYILINCNKPQYMELLNKIIDDYKMLNIVTQNTRQFKALENRAEENLELVTVLNNKRKSLTRAKYIVNLDFTNEEILQYSINRTAIIFNASPEKIKTLKNFEGVVINNIKLIDNNSEYDLQDEYTAGKENKKNVLQKIEQQKYELVGNNGIIEFKEIALDKTLKKV